MNIVWPESHVPLAGPGNCRALLRGCALLVLLWVSVQTLQATDAPRLFPLSLGAEDVVPTGNEWIALPTIRAADGSLGSFNVLSMRDRGLLEVTGDQGGPVLQPYFLVNGKPLPFLNPAWELIEYWIPTAHLTMDGLESTLTYCAPRGARAALVRMTLTNHRTAAVPATLGIKASWGALNRITYVPVALRGERRIGPAPWVDAAEVFSFVTDDTKFAWSLVHPLANSRVLVPPLSVAPLLEAEKEVTLAAGQSAEANFILGVGLEEFSAPHSAKALREAVDRYGAGAVIDQAANWCRARARTTGQPDLDLLMNRNLLFTAGYAWGRTIDTEQFVGVTSRSPRYYVAAAYWDRDAMLWSFPGLLDIDESLAREALEYALTIQLRNTGIHSRFIDGVALEDGFQLDEMVAPVLATAEYVRHSGDNAFLVSHRNALIAIRDRLFNRLDSETGLYSSLQDSQDEFQRLSFLTYDNVLTWRALLDLADLFERLRSPAEASAATQRAENLHAAIWKHAVSDKAPGSTGPIFVCATDGTTSVFADIPPGSLLRLPALGFVSEDDPVFVRTYEWLHSKHYPYGYSDLPYGLPGSYRLPITTSWSVADHLLLARGREQALKILRATAWDGGIITEGLDPNSAFMDHPGGAFATAAGYVAHAICQTFCKHD